MLVLELGESWIDVIVENIALQEVDDFLRSVNPDWLGQFTKKIINENWQARDVIHVGVRDDNVANGLTLSLSQGEADTAGIDSHAIVDEKAGQALRRRGSAGGVKRTG